MVIGVLQFELLIHDAGSLKDKRRVVRSVKDRLHREHLVAVAEVGTLEALNVATMAVALVGTDGAKVGSTLDRITEKLRTLRDAELGGARRELIRSSRGAPGEEEALDEAALARELLRYADDGEDA